MKNMLYKKKNLLIYKNKYKKLLLLYLLIKYKYFINNDCYNISRQWFNKFLYFQKKIDYKFLLKYNFFNKFFFYLMIMYPSLGIFYTYLKKIINNYKNIFLFLNKYFYILKKNKNFFFFFNKSYEFRSFYYVKTWDIKQSKKVYFDKCVTDKFFIIQNKKIITKYNFLKYFFIINSNKLLLYYLLKSCLNYNIFYKLYYIKNFPYLNKKITKKFLIMDSNKYSPVFVINYNKRYNFLNNLNFSKIKIKENYNRYVKNYYSIFFNLNLNNKIFKFNKKKDIRFLIMEKMKNIGKIFFL